MIAHGLVDCVFGVLVELSFVGEAVAVDEDEPVLPSLVGVAVCEDGCECVVELACDDDGVSGEQEVCERACARSYFEDYLRRGLLSFFRLLLSGDSRGVCEARDEGGIDEEVLSE